jgi:uncharacterized membrane protein YkoI
MTNKLKAGLGAGAAIAALAAGGAAIAGATGGGGGDSSGTGDDGSGTPITGTPLDQAKAAALEQTGGGQVTATEVRDEEGYYEVEVRKADGSQFDVHLDRNFNLIDVSPDGHAADSGQ